MNKVRITESQLKTLVKQIIKEERMLNEDNLEVKNIAKQIYTWLKQNGVMVSFTNGSTNNKPTQIGADQRKAEATIYVMQDKTNQTIIKIRLTGIQNIVTQVENKLLTSFPNLDQLNRSMNQAYSGGLSNARQMTGFINVFFDLKEKTTRKGGLVGNTQTNKQIPQQPGQQANQQQHR